MLLSLFIIHCCKALLVQYRETVLYKIIIIIISKVG